MKLLDSLRWRTKLIILFVILVTLSAAITIALLHKVREKYFHRYMLDMIKPINTLVRNQIIHNMNYHEPNHFQHLLESFNFEGELESITVADDSGRIVFCADPELKDEFIPIPGGAELSQGKLDEIIMRNDEVDPNIINTFSFIKNRRECQTCHDSTKTFLGIVRTRISRKAELATHKLLLIFDALGMIIMIIVILVIVANVHSRYFQAPYDRIKAKIKAIQEGNFDTTLEVKGPGELRFLADHISAMSLYLKKTRNELEMLHQKQMVRAGQLASVGEMAASVAHEIKNPAAGIKNALEIVVDENQELQQNEIVKEIFVQINRIVKTIQDLLDFARPSDPRFQGIDICETMRQTVNLYRERFIRNDITIIEHFDDQIPIIDADKDLLNQVFTNLLLNAFQAVLSVEKRLIEIKISASKVKNSVIVTISDSGGGISEENIKKIFTPFFTTKHKGTGLGLSLSLSIIRQHSGTIDAESKPGEGTKFTIILPTVHHT
ncbi:MAG: GHKL domain-containing protein [FCB group bacterium]|nr:GHKL domain-containing protein [FCB group bacterium]